jgi:hypothetical protein
MKTLYLRNENPACEKKTPEYSGVFLAEPEENIGFCLAPPKLRRSEFDMIILFHHTQMFFKKNFIF